MLSDVTLGQYFPGHSLLHRLDPRSKVLITFVYIIAVFIPRNVWGLLLTAVFLTAAVILSRLPLRLVLKSVKPMIPLVIFTSLINIFYVKGEVVASFWIFRISDKGLITAAFVALRIFMLIVGSSLLTYTTSPTALTDALERLLKPLSLLRVNVQEMAMMMTIALRFIPTLIEETDKIMAAQKARGADLESGGVLQRIRALIPILIPLFVSSFRRAYDLATAMECRCYTGSGATRMKQLHLGSRDIFCLTAMTLLVGAVFVLNTVVPPVL